MSRGAAIALLGALLACSRSTSPAPQSGSFSAVTLPPGSILPLFAHLGVVDSAFGAKPALTAWDRMLARPFSP